MSVNGITNAVASTYGTTTTTKAKTVKETETTEDTGVVYEKSDSASTTTSATYKVDTDTVNRLKADLQSHASQMQGLVEKLMGTQAKKSNDILDLIKGLQNGSVKVDAETAAKAQAEIGADGYWGVEQTSNRLVEMAKALSGGDVSKADILIDAMKKGFEAATKAFGKDLPDISQQTIDAALSKMNDWKGEKASV